MMGDVIFNTQLKQQSSRDLKRVREQVIQIWGRLTRQKETREQVP